ncbi:MAG: hypothetical protein ACYDDA_15540, partial [Acidiferrobacteraceae bacterium]
MAIIFQDLCDAYIKWDDQRAGHRISITQIIWALPQAFADYLGCPETYCVELGIAKRSGKYAGLCSFEGSMEDLTYDDVEYDANGAVPFGLYMTLERGTAILPKSRFYAPCEILLLRESIRFKV